MEVLNGALLSSEETTDGATRGVTSPRFLAHISVNQTRELTVTTDFVLHFWGMGRGGGAFVKLRK
jgi:hypothetical protein